MGSCPTGTTVSLSDSDGSQLISWQPDKDFSSVLISCPGIVSDDPYTVSAGDSSIQATMSGLIYSQGSNGGMGDGPDGGLEGRMNRDGANMADNGDSETGGGMKGGVPDTPDQGE